MMAAVVLVNLFLAFPLIFQTYKHFGVTLTPMDVDDHLTLADKGPASMYPPFRYRVLAPLIVREMRVLPGYDIGTDFNESPTAKKDFFHFICLNFGLTLLASGVLFLYLRDFVRTGFAWLGSLLYVFSFTAVTTNYIPMSDPGCQLAIVTAIWFLHRRKPWAFALTCLIGVFAKETVLVVLVPWILIRAWSRRKDLVYLAWLAPSLVAYVAFTRLLPAPSDVPYYQASYLVGNLMRVFSPATYEKTFLFHLFLGYLPLCAAAAGFVLLRFRGVRVRVNPELALFVFLLWMGVVMGIGNNATRLAFMAFPALILFQVRVFEALAHYTFPGHFPLSFQDNSKDSG